LRGKNPGRAAGGFGILLLWIAGGLKAGRAYPTVESEPYGYQEITGVPVRGRTVMGGAEQ